MPHEPDWYNVGLKVLLKNEQGEILALKEPPPTEDVATIVGFCDLPGGRINVEEFEVDYEIIVKRELEEELGKEVKYELNLKPASFGRHNYFSRRQNRDVRIFFLCFEAKYLGGDIKISSEHAGFTWLDLHKIKLEDYFKKGCLEALRRYLALEPGSPVSRFN